MVLDKTVPSLVHDFTVKRLCPLAVSVVVKSTVALETVYFSTPSIYTFVATTGDEDAVTACIRTLPAGTVLPLAGEQMVTPGLTLAVHDEDRSIRATQGSLEPLRVF